MALTAGGIVIVSPTARLAYIPHTAMEELPRHRPELDARCGWATLVDEAVLRAWIVNIGRRDAAERIAHLCRDRDSRTNGSERP